MRRLDVRTRSLVVVATMVAIAAVVGTAGASPAAVDLELNIGASNAFTGNVVLIPNGRSVTVTRRNFVVGVEIDLITAAPGGHPKFQVELGDGLRWGQNTPGAADGCTSTASTAECRSPHDLQPVTGQNGVEFYWDAVAPQNGSYTYKAEIIEAPDVDPVLSNNASSITIVVDEGTGAGGSGGGSPTVSAGAAKLTPAKPTAGQLVRAAVRVTAGGTPIRPAAVACAGAISGVKVKGTAKAAAGTASCSYRTPKAAKGKTLRGAISFTARGKRFTKRFSVKLG